MINSIVFIMKGGFTKDFHKKHLMLTNYLCYKLIVIHKADSHSKRLTLQSSKNKLYMKRVSNLLTLNMMNISQLCEFHMATEKQIIHI